jgi:hypothetical protein
MQVAALVHDLGKTLSLFGERDHNTDCMNRVTGYGHGGVDGLDGLQFQWNHDMFGYMKLKDVGLPQRVTDVLRLHSLREISVMKYPERGSVRATRTDVGWGTRLAPTRDQLMLVDRGSVESAEASVFNTHMRYEDRERALFVQHFAQFDAGTKRRTLEIPSVNVTQVWSLLDKYFPEGRRVAW